MKKNMKETIIKSYQLLEKIIKEQGLLKTREVKGEIRVKDYTTHKFLYFVPLKEAEIHFAYCVSLGHIGTCSVERNREKVIKETQELKDFDITKEEIQLFIDVLKIRIGLEVVLQSI